MFESKLNQLQDNTFSLLFTIQDWLSLDMCKILELFKNFLFFWSSFSWQLVFLFSIPF